MNRNHNSILTNKILGATFKDKAMHLYMNPYDPFKEFINNTLAQYSEYYQYDILNKTSYVFNPYTCDLNQPDIVYEIQYNDLEIEYPITISGNILENDIYVRYPIYIVDDVEEFTKKYPTRVSYSNTITLPIDEIPMGIIYTHTPTNRNGTIYIATNALPCNSGSLYCLDADFNIIQTGILSRISSYSSKYYYCDDEKWHWDENHHSGYYVLDFYVDNTTFRLYDLIHTDHCEQPLLIDSSEYNITHSGINTIIMLIGTEEGRSTYNPLYYSLPTPTGQPDKYWNGKYAFTFEYTPFTNITNGLTTYGYFHELPYDNIIVPSIPSSVRIEIPYEYAKTPKTHEDELLLSISPKFVRPTKKCIVDLYFTKKIVTNWNDINIPLEYEINDPYMVNISEKSVKVFVDNIPVDPEFYITSVDNKVVTITANDIFKSYYNSTSTFVEIYYMVHYIFEQTTEPSYTTTEIKYKDDFSIDINGNIIPMSILSLKIDGINEEYASLRLNLYVDYEYAGIAYDPYRKVIWTYEKNNKYLSARSLNDMSILYNISIFKNPKPVDIIIDNERRTLIDYTIYNDVDIVTIKYLEGYMYLLSNENIIYRIDMFYDKNGIDLEYTDNTYIEYRFDPLVLNTSDKVPVDFTFLRDLSIAVLYDDKTIDIYNTFFDFAIIDESTKKIAFRERYDYIVPFNTKPIGYNRITDLDHRAIEYMNEIRYPGETIFRFFDRICKAYLPIDDKRYGYNSSKQGFYNFCSFAFNYNPKYIENNNVHLYLNYAPIEDDKLGNKYQVVVYVDDVEYTRIGMHEKNKYDSFDIWLYDDKYRVYDLYKQIPSGCFIIWRKYNGKLTNHIEIGITGTNHNIRVVYYIFVDESKVSPITEEFYIGNKNIEYDQDEEYDINPINESHLYLDGPLYINDQSLVEEYFNIAKRHWGYAKLDGTIGSNIFYEQRTKLICYNKINIVGGS